MEPVSAHSPTPGALRPALILSADLGAVLQEGRVLAGEVLQRLDGGSVLIGIGEHRVPAQSSVELAPGERFLFEVRERAGRTELLLLDGRDERRDSPLVRAIREGLGRGRPVAELLSRLLEPGGGPGAAGNGLAAAELARRLQGGALPSEPTGDELARAIARSGLGHEAALLEAVLARASTSRRRQLIRAVWSEIRDALRASREARPGRAPSAAEIDERVRATLRARLAQQGGGEPAVERDAVRRLARELEAIVRSALGDDEDSVGARKEPERHASAPRADRANPRGAEAHVDRPAARAQPARVGASLALREAIVRELAGAAPSPPAAGGEPRVESLKLWLLEALAALGGSERGLGEQVGRTLARIEADQLLNLVRAEAGEPQHAALPIPDDGGWTTLHFYRHPPPKDGEGHAEDESRRVTIELELRSLGPLRADVVLGSHGLTVRVTTPRPDVHARLTAAAAELEERLGAFHESVNLAFQLVEEDLHESDLEGVGYLRDHPLMDRSA